MTATPCTITSAASRCCRCFDPATAIAQFTTATGKVVERVCAAHGDVLVANPAGITVTLTPIKAA